MTQHEKPGKTTRFASRRLSWFFSLFHGFPRFDETHNPKVAGSNPAPATNQSSETQRGGPGGSVGPFGVLCSNYVGSRPGFGSHAIPAHARRLSPSVFHRRRKQAEKPNS